MRQGESTHTARKMPAKLTNVSLSCPPLCHTPQPHTQHPHATPTHNTNLPPSYPQHLGDFPHRLSQHCHAVYEYTPPPPLSWPELAEEVWCHRYYLASLCDESRFPGWPIVDHIPLLQVWLHACMHACNT